MIQSKRRTFNAYIHLFSFIFYVGLFLCFFVQLKIKNIHYDLQIPILFTCWLLFWWQYVKKAFKTIKVSKESKRITISSPFLFRDKELKFEELQGYVTGRIKRGRWGSHKVIWLVQNNRMKYRIDEMFIENVDELEAEFKELKYLGYQKITFYLRIMMLFIRIRIEELQESD